LNTSLGTCGATKVEDSKKQNRASMFPEVNPHLTPSEIEVMIEGLESKKSNLGIGNIQSSVKKSIIEKVVPTIQ
jgi:hypothetical protein